MQCQKIYYTVCSCFFLQITRVTVNSVSTIKFYRVFLKYMKDEVKIYDKLDNKVIKNLLFLLFIYVRTFSKKNYYFTLQTIF